MKHLPANIAALYAEARASAQVNAPTACVMVCRTIVMHVAVERGAPENQRFVAYVDYLADNHHVPVGARVWLDRIRQVGNEAVHEIVVRTGDDAQVILSFTSMLLKMIYEFPQLAAPP